MKLQHRAKAIRRFLVSTVNGTGGHLASNLGVVELSLALHQVFSTPTDKIVWDVGHQSYVHKILTGRRRDMHKLRQLGGISGFPKISESPHDAFGTGHSSTAISAALGLAVARDLRGGTEKVVAVVGDGSLTGGLAFEGLNNAGRANTDMLVILNDNQMSISRNVGALQRHLNSLRTARHYTATKAGIKETLGKLPLVGSALASGLEHTRDALKYALIPGVMFEELGFRYIGPVDGHDADGLVEVLSRVREMKGPVFLHVLTTKGKGYLKAESAPDVFHGVSPNGGDIAGETFTDVFSRVLVQRAEKESRIAAITAAMPDGTGLSEFRKRFPQRFFDVGIAEGHAITFAAGLAAGGMRPVVACYSSFLQRAYDNILHCVAAQGLPVVFAVDRAGIVAGDGETHQGLYDLAYLSHIPGMTILAPTCAEELPQMLDYALAQNAPVAIRYPRDVAPQNLVGSLPAQGDAAIVAVGAMMEAALEAARILAHDGTDVAVYNARFVKPVDTQLARELTRFSHVFTVEDACAAGGYGHALREFVPQVIPLAFPDEFIGAGTRAQLFEQYKLDATGIAEKIKLTIKGE